MSERSLIALALAVALAGCAVGPDYQRPQSDLPVLNSGAQPVSAQWWQGFNDAVLNNLIEEAFAHNLDLVQAAARVAEYRALVGSARADQLPQLNLSASNARGGYSTEGLSQVSPDNRTLSDRQVQANASWELDLWGRLARGREAAAAELSASEAARDGVRLSLAASVANGYFDLRALDRQLDIARQTLESRRRTAALQLKRYQAGTISELEARQAEAEAADAAQRVPQLEQQVASTANALATLLGRTPRELVESPVARGTSVGAIGLPPTLPSGLPSDLLERRPDVREAEQKLVAANARIGQAKAQWFPAITLTGSYGSESQALSDLLLTGSAATWSLAGSLAQPLFDGGRIAASVEAADARTQQATAAYRSTVQKAFRETLDALVAMRKTGEQLNARQQRVGALQQTVDLSGKRYEAGYSSYLDVLDAERSLFQAQLDEVSSQRDRLQAAVNLYLALGGGWQSGQPPADATAQAAPAGQTESSGKAQGQSS